MSENVTAGAALKPNQQRAVMALAGCKTLDQAAAEAGVSRKTLCTWRRQPTFRAALQQAQGDALADMARQLVGLGEQVTQALKDALDAAQPIGVRLKAAELVTSKAPALLQIGDLAERVKQLEAAAAGDK